MDVTFGGALDPRGWLGRAKFRRDRALFLQKFQVWYAKLFGPGGSFDVKVSPFPFSPRPTALLKYDHDWTCNLQKHFKIARGP